VVICVLDIFDTVFLYLLLLLAYLLFIIIIIIIIVTTTTSTVLTAAELACSSVSVKKLPECLFISLHGSTSKNCRNVCSYHFMAVQHFSHYTKAAIKKCLLAPVYNFNVLNFFAKVSRYVPNTDVTVFAPVLN
jgi:hypothetical protein